MRTGRFFHPGPLTDSAEFTLPRDAARHAVKVLRLREGAALTVFDGSGREWPATLRDPRAGTIVTGAAIAIDRESPLVITLVQGISRGERMDLTVQKAVELGVAAIQPVFAERSVVRLEGERSAKRVAHWQAVATAACEQCGRNVVPRVFEPMAFDEWTTRPTLPAVMLEPDAAVEPAALEMVLGRRPAALGLLVGPEGGFSDAEVREAREAGCIAMRLGPRVLRTETAGIAAIAALQALYGDYR